MLIFNTINITIGSVNYTHEISNMANKINNSYFG